MREHCWLVRLRQHVYEVVLISQKKTSSHFFFVLIFYGEKNFWSFKISPIFREGSDCLTSMICRDPPSPPLEPTKKRRNKRLRKKKSNFRKARTGYSSKSTEKEENSSSAATVRLRFMLQFSDLLVLENGDFAGNIWQFEFVILVVSGIRYRVKQWQDGCKWRNRCAPDVSRSIVCWRKQQHERGWWNNFWGWTSEWRRENACRSGILLRKMRCCIFLDFLCLLSSTVIWRKPEGWSP